MGSRDDCVPLNTALLWRYTIVKQAARLLQGDALTATGSGSIVKALQGAKPSRDMIVRVPSRAASPAAVAAVDHTSGADASGTEVSLMRSHTHININ